MLPRGIHAIKFLPDDKKHETEDKRAGTVVLQYTNGTSEHFPNISRKDFFRWYNSGYKRAPAGVRIKNRPLEITEAYEYRQADLEHDNGLYSYSIPLNDYLGQVTGVASDLPMPEKRGSPIFRAIAKIRQRISLLKKR